MSEYFVESPFTKENWPLVNRDAVRTAHSQALIKASGKIKIIEHTTYQNPEGNFSWVIHSRGME